MNGIRVQRATTLFMTAEVDVWMKYFACWGRSSDLTHTPPPADSSLFFFTQNLCREYIYFLSLWTYFFCFFESWKLASEHVKHKSNCSAGLTSAHHNKRFMGTDSICCQVVDVIQQYKERKMDSSNNSYSIFHLGKKHFKNEKIQNFFVNSPV